MGGAGGGKQEHVGAPIPSASAAQSGGTDDADGTSTESPVLSSRGTASSQDTGVREAERQSIRATAGAYSVVGPQPGQDETAPAGTVRRTRRSSAAPSPLVGPEVQSDLRQPIAVPVLVPVLVRRVGTCRPIIPSPKTARQQRQGRLEVRSNRSSTKESPTPLPAPAPLRPYRLPIIRTLSTSPKHGW